MSIIFISGSAINSLDRTRLKDTTGMIRIEEITRPEDVNRTWPQIYEYSLSLRAEQVFIANDSVFGPFFDLAPLIQDLPATEDLDFWGLIDAWDTDKGWYLPSSFLYLSPKAFASEAFRTTFSPSLFGEEDALMTADAGLTPALLAEGLKYKARLPGQSLDPHAPPGLIRDPALTLPGRLIREHGYPFLRRFVLVENPENFPDTGSLIDTLSGSFPADAENIRQFLISQIRHTGQNAPSTTEVNVLCHLYYPSTVYYFLLQIAPLQEYNAFFIFNLSTALFTDRWFCSLLRECFPGAVLLHTPNKGRDIGAKLALIDTLLRMKRTSGISLIIHDKISPHSPTGIAWRNSLYKIIHASRLPGVLRIFEQEKDVGVLVSKEFVRNEYNPDTGGFNNTSSDNITGYIKKYNLQLSDSGYNFAAGTIFWIRTSVLQNFFGHHQPLEIRGGLEAGNALDFLKGTNIHAWERLFSFLALAQGLKVRGI